MKISGLQLGNIVTFEVKAELFDDFGGEDLFKRECLLTKDDTTGHLFLQVADALWEIVGYLPNYQMALDNVLDRNLPRLCWITGTHPKSAPHRTITIQVHEFSDYRVWVDVMAIGVDEKIVEEVQRRHLSTNSSREEVLAWLRTELTIESSSKGKYRIIVSSSPRRLEIDSAFRIYGESIAIDVRTENHKYRISRIVQTSSVRTYRDFLPLLLVEGNVQFHDATLAGTATLAIQSELKDIIQQSDSYFKLWSDYNDLEDRNLRQKASEFGIISYTECRSFGDGSWRFVIQNHEEWDRLIHYFEESPTLEARESWDIPDYLRPGIETILSSTSRKSKNRYFIGILHHIHHPTQTVELKPIDNDEDGDIQQPYKKGILVFSLQGDKTRLARRKKALDIIQSGSSPMPQLGLILEKKPFASATNRSKIKPVVTPRVKKVFPEPLNPKQQDAIAVALNTPDIALIIGPPGTGKTQIIAAICERLAEYAEEAHHPVAKTISLTAFQHVAVEHTSARTRVYDIPTLIIGKKTGQKGEYNSISLWLEEKIEQLQTGLPESPLRTRIRKIRDVYVSYLKVPTDPHKTAEVLQEILDLSLEDICGALRDEVVLKKQTLLKKQQLGELDDARMLTLRAVRGLRTDAVSFSDDGPRSAQKLLKRLETLQWELLKEDQRLLKETAIAAQPSKELFVQLQDLQNRLIDELQAEKVHLLPPSIDAEVQSLFVRVLNEMSRRQRETPEGIDVIISELCEELQTAPNDVKKALKEYQVILASTVQQADSKQIMKLKEDPDSQYFNTIIVEEAARANPLDLLIPMAKAERRIILVGDHRQLPHLLEPAVEKAIQESANNDLKTRYQESLFGRLVEYFREREKTDHIPRVVMLDTQYRMHPFLGKFISRTFYESQGDMPIKSVKPEDIFEHGVSTYQGKVVVWINVPLNEGEETRGQSKSRPVEAKRIAKEVKKILEENPELSIGMIAFYAAQVNELWKALRHADMAELDDEKDYIFSQRWRDAKHERFIGTVDASQGKEFDVVFLSMTRSNRISLSDEQRTWNQKFGFLRLENRLNVAMSRAKKLLFVVGDDRMFLTKEGAVNPLAQAAVPGLYAFWEATDNQGIAVPVENKGKKYGIRI